MVLDFIYRGTRKSLVDRLKEYSVGYVESQQNGKNIILLEDTDLGFMDWDSVMVSGIDYSDNQIIRVSSQANTVNFEAFSKLFEILDNEE